MFPTVTDIMDILTRGTNKWLQYGGRHELAVQVFGWWMIYQLFLHFFVIVLIIKLWKRRR
jgi:uncharacterized membrane protein